MFKKVISMFQLLTIIVEVTPAPLSGSSLAQITLENAIVEVSKMLITASVSRHTVNEKLLKNYADYILKDAIRTYKTSFTIVEPTKPKYNLISRFLKKHLDAIAIIYRLQQLGNKKSENLVSYRVVNILSYNFYLFRILIQWNLLPVVENKGRVSFNSLYTHMTDLLQNVNENDSNRKIVIDLINNTLKISTALIKKHWKKGLSKLKRVSINDIEIIEKIVVNIDGNIRIKFNTALNKLYDEGKIDDNIRFKLNNFYNTIYSIIHIIDDYTTMISILRSDYTSKKDSMPTGDKLQMIKRYCNAVQYFVENMYLLAIKPEKINEFLKDMEPHYKEIYTICYNGQWDTDASNILFEMLLATRTLGKEYADTEIKLEFDKKEGVRVKISNEALKILLSDNLDDKEDIDSSSDYEDVDINILDMKDLIDDEKIDLPTWIKWAFIIGFIILVVCILAYIYSKYR